MLKRQLATLLVIVLSGLGTANAIELSIQDKQHLLADTQSHKDAQHIASLALSDQSDKANFDLLRIKQPEQEVVRFLAIKAIAESHPKYTSDLAVFVDSQRKLPSSLSLVEQGDGFRFRAPAFSYQQMAQRLMDDWKLNEKVISLYIGVENEQLDLRRWLTENPELTSQREKLLIDNIDKLSEQGLGFLTSQVTNNHVLSWLPSSELMSVMASASQSQDLYAILWKMKASGAMHREIERLGSDGSEFSIQQLIQASQNPSLNQRSLQLLARYAPTSQSADDFLISKMSNKNDAQVITKSIQEYGYGSWLKEWVTEHPEIFNR
ncbi:hypothetical protein A9264_15670 [Vibrio sp. UCD-FRSSP16_10]|uniref:hypothetical protein n=1 Tax=unclassified Vibrio TaxID=2614977 RepID=UPI0007FE1E1B|nr:MULTISPECIES: hypothetical protein [unclassified Vibrio]OBT12918.1 hypothetical protein A9260_15660 [Vibrio sp. UCD-FRSSP16_30]OBT18381.1 hypothetical protein A9264_15670 [Vibrio sp. UCD-FRSSP16_10]